ncbi:protein FAM180A [Lepisosteus oculatus]|uniref:protein FAM180A n=1 Tax=Lepisosteus oculatus TaxID=7918 RepID=UPI0003EAB6BF|nr:PREDICTED: protein FAM180A-like [Lepisosteus oculatus]
MTAAAQLGLCLLAGVALCIFGGSRKDTDFYIPALQGLATVTSLNFIKNVSDANLMYEFLLGGLVIDDDDNIYMLDEEMASMRKGKVFITLLNDYVPKTVITMERMLAALPYQEKPLELFRFETLVLGTVYSAYQMRRQHLEHPQKAWGGLLVRLVNATLVDLRRRARRSG